MTQAITMTNGQGAIMEQVLMAGDLSKLTPEQRTSYYLKTCESLGLNPMTRPFEYITLNGKLTLYARKDCTDQLRSLRGVSIGKPDIKFEDSLIIVAVEARDRDGRTDSDIGVVNKSDMRGDLSNVLMKAVTKAKRRVTLSICGLGMLDETEVETIPDAKPYAEPQQVAAVDDWKRELIDLGKAAGELLAISRPDIAAQLSAAQSAAREVLRKNGHSAQQERVDARSALQAAIAAANDDIPA